MQKIFAANGTLMSFLHRLFYSTQSDKRMKVGAAVVAARRGGLPQKEAAIVTNFIR